MNLINSTLQHHETIVTFVLEPQSSGRFVASVVEFPSCRGESDNRESALALVHQQLQGYLSQVEVVKVALSDRPQEDVWDQMFGLFKDDLDFAAIAADIRAIGETDDDSEVDPAVYLS